ncbi:hypothetical protein GCM10008908_17210 [Clostridium subterminale]|uniref:SH3b domain-containing protein n=1 Tax=Clostridium subterminale TaxID=1550 RepID=A0ABN1KN98_CLOSU
MIKTFFIYVLLLTSGGLGILYYLLNDKYNKQNIQVRVLTKQNNSLTSQLNTINRPNETLKVYYRPVRFNTGETLKRCSLYISPLSNSPILRSIPSNSKIAILYAVEALETLWYEVRIITSDTVNTKGFVRQELVKELQVVETHIIRN